MSERNYVIVCTDHKGNVPGALLFWGERTADNEKRSFGGYTQDLNKCERYTLGEVINNYKFPVYGDGLNKDNYLFVNDFLIRIDQLEELGYVKRLLCVRK